MFTIRDAKLTDAPALAALMCELGYETTPAEMCRRLKSILCDVSYRTFLAEVDGKVCGMVGTLAYYSFEHNDPSGRIVALVVRKDFALGGNWAAFGRDCGEGLSSDEASSASRLDTRLTRKDAHKFYESFGYERNGWRFVKQLAGERLMELDVATWKRSCGHSSCIHRNSNAQAADTSNNPAQTEAVTVTAEAIGSLTSTSPEESTKQKTQVPGAFTIKDGR